MGLRIQWQTCHNYVHAREDKLYLIVVFFSQFGFIERTGSTEVYQDPSISQVKLCTHFSFHEKKHLFLHCILKN